MKKTRLLLFAVTLVLSLLLFGCTKEDDDSQVPTCLKGQSVVDGVCVDAEVQAPTCSENQSIVDGVCVDDEPVGKYDFPNDALSTKTEIIDKVLFYRDKLVGFAGGEGEEEGEMSNSGMVFLSDSMTYYTREDFTLYDDPNYLSNIDVDTESMTNTVMTINELKDVVGLCEDFVEGEYCTVDTEREVSYKVKMQTDGDRLYIEAYVYKVETSVDYYYVNAEILYFDLIDGLVYFEYVRDHHDVMNGNESGDQYYDLFIEGTGTTNISLGSNGDVYYQYYSSSGDNQIRFSSGEEVNHVAYRNELTDMYYHTNYDATGNLTFSTISFYNGNKLNFEYRYNIPNYDTILKWNILETTGWSKVGISSQLYSDSYLYIDDEIIMTEFEIIAQHDYRECVYAKIEMVDGDITQQIIDLSLYNLLFEEVTLNNINIEKTYLEENYDTFKTLYGFTESSDDDRDEMYALFPFFADETIVSELADLLSD